MTLLNALLTFRLRSKKKKHLQPKEIAKNNRNQNQQLMTSHAIE